MFDKLFSPITIKGMELKNRVILPAMGTKFAGKASYVTPQLVSYTFGAHSNEIHSIGSLPPAKG